MKSSQSARGREAPRVTVITAAHNEEKNIQQEIESILQQTFHDFELIIIEDASTDHTRQMIERFDDPRIRLICNSHCQGAARSRNIGIQAARGEYIAILDADDAAFPNRLKRQVELLDGHPDIAAIGSDSEYIDLQGNHLYFRRMYPEPVISKWQVILKMPFVHSSVMYRKAAAMEVNNYDPDLKVAEDYKLVSAISERHSIAQIPDVLIRYRINPDGLTSAFNPLLITNTISIVKNNLKTFLGIQADEAFIKKLVFKSYQDGIDARLLPEFYFHCLEIFLQRNSTNRKERERLFYPVLEDLFVMYKKYPETGAGDIRVTWQYIKNYAWTRMFSLAFLGFLFRISRPKGIRKKFKAYFSK